MHFRSIRRGTVVVIRTAEGEQEGKALRKEGESWILEGDLVATSANTVRFRPKPRGGDGKGAPPTGGRSPSEG